MRLTRPKAEDIFFQTLLMRVFRLKSSMHTPRDFAEDTLLNGKSINNKVRVVRLTSKLAFALILLLFGLSQVQCEHIRRQPGKTALNFV